MKPLALLMSVVVCGTAVGCAPPPPASNAQVKQATRSDAWPQLLAHCLRSPDCDPMTGVSAGAGEASTHAGEVTWFARNAAAEEGAALMVCSLKASRGRGGKAGLNL